MRTIADIVEAVKALPLDDKRELLRQLTLLLTAPDVPSNAKVDDDLPFDFTERLVAHFHRAKRAALLRTI